ncbi:MULTISPECIES: BrnT family toxin [Neorhizobium]|uniref:BrnT family toxin n=2 Tax=Neorhizobium TaxID=1525371 RepID=A0A0T7GBJ3_NEOGA|nr:MULTISPECIES: BrnT family toxin [Neorhizobium]CDZ44556.1 Hypothetical protein NGAL_HAMBI1189_04560 [Neorhizobium galegae bv. officinalis]
MEFEWDEVKRQQVIKERGVDFLYAAGIFEGAILTRIDDRADYGEVRKIALGMVEGECFVVVFTERGDVIRLITAWKGGRHDRSEYQKSIAHRAEENEGGGGAFS